MQQINQQKENSFLYLLNKKGWLLLIDPGDQYDWVQGISILHQYTSNVHVSASPHPATSYSLLRPPVWAQVLTEKADIYWGLAMCHALFRTYHGILPAKLWDRFFHYPPMPKLGHKVLRDMAMFTQLRCSIQEMFVHEWINKSLKQSSVTLTTRLPEPCIQQNRSNTHVNLVLTSWAFITGILHWSCPLKIHDQQHGSHYIVIATAHGEILHRLDTSKADSKRVLIKVAGFTNSTLQKVKISKNEVVSPFRIIDISTITCAIHKTITQGFSEILHWWNIMEKVADAQTLLWWDRHDYTHSFVQVCQSLSLHSPTCFAKMQK